MNVRVAGIAAICAAAALGGFSGARAAGAESLGLRFSSANALSGAETMMRRQPAPVNPRTTPLSRRLRKGTISLGAQAGYGFVRGSSELNDHFDGGLGYAFRFRYSLSQRSALGFSFESQRYKTRAGLPVDTGPFAAKDSELVVTTVASEMVLFFHRERDTTPYLVGGLGFASPNVNYGSKESRRLDEGPFLVVGAGLERFVRPRVSLDFSLRGYAEVGNSELSLFSQIGAGIHLYPGD
jgi:hypothetical protein